MRIGNVGEKIYDDDDEDDDDVVSRVVVGNTFFFLSCSSLLLAVPNPLLEIQTKLEATTARFVDIFLQNLLGSLVTTVVVYACDQSHLSFVLKSSAIILSHSQEDRIHFVYILMDCPSSSFLRGVCVCAHFLTYVIFVIETSYTTHSPPPNNQKKTKKKKGALHHLI